MYRRDFRGEYILRTVYVDDLLYRGSSNELLEQFEKSLAGRVDITCNHGVEHFLGLKISYLPEAIHLSAAKYAEELGKGFNIAPAPLSTPYRTSRPNHKPDNKALSLARLQTYQQQLGCLLFASVTCRPDLSYIASQLAQYSRKPTVENLLELQRALEFFISTPNVGLCYSTIPTASFNLIDYVDADHAAYPDNRRSRTGAGCPVIGGSRIHRSNSSHSRRPSRAAARGENSSLGELSTALRQSERDQDREQFREKERASEEEGLYEEKLLAPRQLLPGTFLSPPTPLSTLLDNPGTSLPAPPHPHTHPPSGSCSSGREKEEEGKGITHTHHPHTRHPHSLRSTAARAARRRRRGGGGAEATEQNRAHEGAGRAERTRARAAAGRTRARAAAESTRAQADQSAQGRGQQRAAHARAATGSNGQHRHGQQRAATGSTGTGSNRQQQAAQAQAATGSKGRQPYRVQERRRIQL
ncbi:unnamed protein product [Closterium sp. NIES-54]